MSQLIGRRWNGKVYHNKKFKSFENDNGIPKHIKSLYCDDKHGGICILSRGHRGAHVTV